MPSSNGTTGSVDYSHPFEPIEEPKNELSLVSTTDGVNKGIRRTQFRALCNHSSRGIIDTVHDKKPLQADLGRVEKWEEDELTLHQNTVRLRLGWKSDEGEVTIFFTRMERLPVPGSYKQPEVFLQELHEVFRNMNIPSIEKMHSLSLDTILGLDQVPSTNQVRFRLKNKVSSGPMVNYLELTINPHMSKMLGLLPNVMKNEDSGFTPQTVKLVGGRVLIRNENLVPRIAVREKGETWKEPLPDWVTNTFTTPYSLNMDMGITSMYIYMPETVESADVGQTSAPLLAVVPIEGKPNERVHKNIVNLMKRKISQDRLEEIRVEILDHNGDRIKFSSGVNAVYLECLLQAMHRAT